jgi:hypothetical protein
MKEPTSEKWHIDAGSWSILDACLCRESFCPWVFIARDYSVTNWSSLEVVYGLLYKLMCKQALNTIIQIEVIWSTKPSWNMCIIWYFSSVINSNKQRSSEKLVGAVIQTSDLRDPRWVCFQLSHATSLIILSNTSHPCPTFWRQNTVHNSRCAHILKKAKHLNQGHLQKQTQTTTIVNKLE